MQMLGIEVKQALYFKCKKLKYSSVKLMFNSTRYFRRTTAKYSEKLKSDISIAGVGLEGPNEGRVFACWVDAKGVAPDYVVF